MGRPTIRISEWAVGELRRRAGEEGRTVVSVVDRLLGKPSEASVPVGVVAKMAADLSVLPPPKMVYALETCPRCGCPESMHRAGGSGKRCEKHPPCVWDRGSAQ